MAREEAFGRERFVFIEGELQSEKMPLNQLVFGRDSLQRRLIPW